MEKSETGCCPKFNPEKWDEKTLKFESRLFLRDHVMSFMHMPLNFGSVMKRSMQKIKKADALDKEMLVLSDEKSLWGADIFVAVSKVVPNAKMVKISGTFLTKVFEGPYREMGEWIKEMNEYVESSGETPKKLFFFYTTCPKCAKEYGKNYVVILAKI
ncbi:MAG: hypothetical protein HQ536_04125 [Parcubacteria group bacterium]|nr:hypothetical protein [Parcubacteria group bacterium]